jgi:diguanylate cyclase (GGDEF)-like protein
MDWSKIPDILGIAALACAFASIVRQDKTPAHRLWLIGWSAIVLHFVVLIFANLSGAIGLIGNILSLAALAAAGFCFMWATVPTETKVRSRRLACVAFATCSLYMALAQLENVPGWLLDCSAIAIAIAPLMVAIGYKRYGQHALRWLTVGLHFALGAELMVLRRQFPNDLSVGIDAILFVVFLGCCIYFWYSHTNGTTGSVITILGFMAWALVFVVAPMLDHFVPHFHMEGEVWNLPKYVVAIGMLLLLLENQIERSRYLALHDELTALANRRLFQEQLDQALERARRTNGKVALMQIDLDGFKEVNDTHGHHVGDLLLCHVGTMLMRRARRSDTVARTGGDEFSLVLENFTKREDVELVAEALLQMFAQPVVLAGIELRVGASIGIALFPDDAQNARTLCIEADMRMYAVKQDRKDPPHQPNVVEEPASLAG